MTLCRRAALGVALAVTVATTAAEAHGPPPGITGVPTADTSGPRVASITEGLVQWLGGRWRYVCPVQFGDEASPPARSTDGERTFVVGSDDLFVLDPDGRVTAQGRPELSRRTVLELVAASGQLFALRLANGATELRRVDDADAPVIWQDTGPYQSISVGADELWVARAESGRGHALRLALDGAVIQEREFAVDPGDAVTHVATVAGALYVSVVTPTIGGKLLYLGSFDGGPTVVLEAPSPLFGPLAIDAASSASAWAVTTGTLYALSGGTATPWASELRASSVASAGDRAFLCARTRLFALEAAGPGGLVLDLADLEGPSLDTVAPDLRAPCSEQWAVAQYDLQTIGVLSLPDAGAEADASPEARASGSDGSGCGVARDAAQDTHAWLLGVGLLLGCVRRFMAP